MAAVLTLVAIPAVGVMAADTYTVNKGGCYVKNGTQLTPYEEKTYSSEEEATYTATIAGATSKEENEDLAGFCLDGKFEEGVLNEDGSRSYTFPKGTTGEHVIYGIRKDETYKIKAVQEYCHDVTITPEGSREYRVGEEVTYTIKGAGDVKPSYFVINGKKVKGTLTDEYTMTYTFGKNTEIYSSNMIYGIGEKTPDSTYTVDVSKLPSNGVIVDKTGVCTYSSEEEVTYTIEALEGIRPGYFVINGERVDGKVVNKQTLSYTFPKGTTGVYTLYGVTEDFGDVNKEDWFYDDVTYVKGKGYMTGLDSYVFGPSVPLARAQFMVILNRMAGNPKATIFEDRCWLDITEDWYEDAIYWGIQYKIMTGYSNSQYWGTADILTREQLATALYRYAEYKEYDVTQRAKLDGFEDASSVSGFAKEAVEWAVAEGIITGKDNGTKLDPQGETARAQCAAIIQRFVENYEEK